MVNHSPRPWRLHMTSANGTATRSRAYRTFKELRHALVNTWRPAGWTPTRLHNAHTGARHDVNHSRLPRIKA